MADAVRVRPSWLARLANLARLVFWLGLAYLVLQQYLGSGRLELARQQALASFQDERKSRVIALIHRQENVSILGVPVSSYINVSDSESILRVIRMTPPEQPIDLILHTPGGLVLAAEQIARALAERPGKVTVFIPHYAMSGGTLISLAADEIVMDANAVIGPVDPQLGSMPAASIARVLELKPIERVSDETIILADVAAKARVQVEAVVLELLAKHGLPSERARATAKTLTDGRFTHDYPITVSMARELGLKVTTEMPRSVYQIMDLYPQAAARRPSVIYIDPPTSAPQGPRRAPTPAPARDEGK